MATHEHAWRQESLTVHPMAGNLGGAAGVTVRWFCGKRSCMTTVDKEYRFRRPAKNSDGNAIPTKVKVRMEDHRQRRAPAGPLDEAAHAEFVSFMERS